MTRYDQYSFPYRTVAGRPSPIIPVRLFRNEKQADVDAYVDSGAFYSVFQPYASVATNLLFFTKGTPTKEIWYYEHKLPEGQKSYSKTKAIKISEFDTLKEWWNNREENEQAWKVDIGTIKENGFNLDIKNPHKEEEEEIHTSSELLDMLHKSFTKSDALLNKLKEELL